MNERTHELPPVAMTVALTSISGVNSCKHEEASQASRGHQRVQLVAPLACTTKGTIHATWHLLFTEAWLAWLQSLSRESMAYTVVRRAWTQWVCWRMGVQPYFGQSSSFRRTAQHGAPLL